MKPALLIKKIVLISICIPLGFACLVLTHELGHALGAKIVGDNVNFIHVWPGYEFYPNIGQRVTYEWPDGALATIQTFSEIGAKPQLFGSNVFLSESIAAFIMLLLGSGITWLISIVFLAVLHRFKPKGIWLSISIVGALFYLDIFAYSVFPHFYDLPHLIFMGGQHAEPVMAFSSLGVNEDIAAISIILVCLIQTLFLAKVLIKNGKSV